MLHPSRAEEETLQYEIAGYDFVLDLLAFLDTVEPLGDFMLRLQSLDTPLWKIKFWWPVVKTKMQEHCSGVFRRIISAENPRAGSTYKSVTLLEGWFYQ